MCFVFAQLNVLKMQSSHNIKAMGMYHVSTLLHYKREEWIEFSPSVRSVGDLNAWNGIFDEFYDFYLDFVVEFLKI
jgi:hypothetical protein